MEQCPLDRMNRLAVGLAGVFWVDPQLSEVQGNKQVHGRERTSDVTGLARGYGVYHQASGPHGRALQAAGCQSHLCARVASFWRNYHTPNGMA